MHWGDNLHNDVKFSVADSLVEPDKKLQAKLEEEQKIQQTYFMNQWYILADSNILYANAIGKPKINFRLMDEITVHGLGAFQITASWLLPVRAPER